MPAKELAKDVVDQLKSAIADARKRELSFALCLGKEAATTVLATHKTKNAEAMKREAKQAGETNKLAWGTMAVEGKIVKLSCVDPDIPAGLARKTRELLKLAGVKSKIQLLDAEGNLLEEDADPEDTDGPEGAAVDPAAEKWAAEKARLQAALDQAASTPAIDLTAAREALTAAAEKAAAGDASSALGAVPAIEKQIADAMAAVKLAEEDKARWEEAAAKLKPMVDAAVAVKSAAAGKISAVWSFAQSKASGPKPDFAAAIKSIPMLVKLIQSSQGEATAEAVPVKGVAAESGAQRAAEDLPVSAAPAGGAAGAGSAEPPMPAAAPAPPGGAAAPPDAAKAPAPAPAADAKDADEWKKALDLFNLRLVPVERHAQSGAVPQVKPKIDAIKADRDKAVAKANAGKPKEALADLKPLYKRCDDVEALADGLAHYNTILAQRQATVNAHGPGPHPVAEVEKLIVEQKKLLTDAQALAAAEKFAEAVKKLDLIPPLEDKIARLDQMKKDYDTYIANCDPIIAAIDGLPAATRAVMQADIDKWKTEYAAAKIGVTKDYAVSARLLSPLLDRVQFLQTSLAAAGAYVTALPPFEVQLAIYKAHKGRPGIEEQYLAMERDLASAKSEAASGRHSTAAALLNRSKPTWPTLTATADACLAYFTKRDAVAKTVADLKPKAGAAPALKQAEALLATAATQALNKDFKGALANATEAEKRAAEAKTAADATEGLGKLKDTAALDGMAADFDKATKVYDDMRANVAGQDPAGTFAALLKSADAEAKKAKDEKGKPKPDFARARKSLDAAIKILEGALVKILGKGPFERHLADAKTQATALPGKNADNIIKTAIATVNQRIKEAEALANGPKFDYPAGEVKLTDAKKVADKADADATAWPQVKADRAATVAVKGQITAAGAPVVKLMAKRTKDLDAILKEVDAALKKNDLATAGASAARGAALAGPTTADVVTCAAFDTRRKNFFTNWLPTIAGPGKEAGAPALAKARKKLAEAEAMMAQGMFDGGNRMLSEVSWAVQEADAAIKANATYEPARKAADTKIKAVAKVRNAAIEEPLKAVEKEYADGLALAKERKYVPAQTIMTAIPPKLDKLPARAKDWAKFAEARKPAEAKLKAAEAHKNKAVIEPLTTRLRARFDAAVKQAEGGDAGPPAAEMKAILPEAAEAIKTADSSAAFAKQQAALGNAGPSKAMLAEAKKRRDKLATLPQAAAAKPDLDFVASEIAAIEAGGLAPDVAKSRFKGATDALTRAEVAIQQAKMIGGSVKAARDQVNALKGHAQKDYIAPEIAKLEADITAAEAQGNAPAGAGAATKAVEVIMKAVADTKKMADDQAAYLVLRASPEVEPAVETLDKHKQRYAIKPALDTIRAKLKSAADQSAAKKPAESLKLCQEVKDLILSSRVMADMRENDATKPPSVADIKAILAQPNGQQQLDAMMDGLEPNAKRAILRVAFEARFGVKLRDFADAARTVENPDGNKDGPNIQRFYDIMSHLPAKDVVFNDSMREFQITPGGGSFYEDGAKKNVVMNEGDAAKSGAYGFGQEHEVGGADPECQPANKDEVSFFSWNTMHEVGHAVDDKHGYMEKNQARPDHGGWTNYVRNIKPIAAVLAGHFKYDETYCAQYLAHNANAALPPPPKGTQPEDWESRRVAMRAYVDMAGVGNNPWSNNATAAKLAIAGVVYQESYPNSWTSYALAARKQGMTGYQFRAPGEWFAELYAAYHAGKLKPTHPAVGWLKAL